MIYGIGVDLVNTERMASSLGRFGDRIAEKVLTSRELDEFHSTRLPASFLAKRFAAKEAMAKALGTGFRQNLSLKHIEITHDAHGKPRVICKERAKELLDECGISDIHISITDERDNALAFVVLESCTRQPNS